MREWMRWCRRLAFVRRCAPSTAHLTAFDFTSFWTGVVESSDCASVTPVPLDGWYESRGERVVYRLFVNFHGCCPHQSAAKPKWKLANAPFHLLDTNCRQSIVYIRQRYSRCAFDTVSQSYKRNKGGKKRKEKALYSRDYVYKLRLMVCLVFHEKLAATSTRSIDVVPATSFC